MREAELQERAKIKLEESNNDCKTRPKAKSLKLENVSASRSERIREVFAPSSSRSATRSARERRSSSLSPANATLKSVGSFKSVKAVSPRGKEKRESIFQAFSKSFGGVHLRSNVWASGSEPCRGINPELLGNRS